jgi:hypothetical protein
VLGQASSVRGMGNLEWRISPRHESGGMIVVNAREIAVEVDGVGTPAEVMELGLRLIDAARREGVTFGNRP